MNGSCLCGTIAFEVNTDNPNIYQCFCSLCRKTSGSQSNSAFVVPEQNFAWTTDTSNISTYSKPTGFRSDFCSMCGSPVPNLLRGRPYFWVPAGLMDEPFQAQITRHIYAETPSHWTSTEPAVRDKAMPEMDLFISEMEK
jgi:hypothetical protein